MEEVNTQVIEDAVKELKETDEEKLKETVEQWFTETRADGIKIGAQYIASAIFHTMKKHINKDKPSLRDYKRMTDDLINILSVQLNIDQNNSEEGKI